MQQTYPKTSYSRVLARRSGSPSQPTKENLSGPINEHVARVSGKWLILTVLLAAWAGIGAWAVSQWSEPQYVPLTYVSGQKAKADAVPSKTAAAKSGSDLKIHLEVLAASQERTEKSFNSPKNIFAQIYPGGASVSAAASPSVAIQPAPVVPQPTPAELAQQASRRELAGFRYLGYLTRDGRDEAFLAKGNFLHITGVGQTIDQKVLVKTVTPSGVTLHDTSSHVEQVVKLAGDASMSAPVAATTVTPQPPVIETTQALPPPASVPPPSIEIPVPPSQPKTSM
jgi:hypothetical protein